MKHNITCLCGNCFPISYEEEIDIDENLEKILNGTFMSYNCPACKKNTNPSSE